MVIANLITGIRFFFLPIPCVLIVYDLCFIWMIIVFVLVLLGMTDCVDGVVAQKEGSTQFGSFLDQLSDKIFVIFVFFLLLAIGILDIWFVLLILYRECYIVVLRFQSLFVGKIILSNKFGKIKTIIQMSGLIIWFLCLVLTIQIFVIISIYCLFYVIFINNKIKYFNIIIILLFTCIIKCLFSHDLWIIIYCVIVIITTVISGLYYLYEKYINIYVLNIIYMLVFSSMIWFCVFFMDIYINMFYIFIYVVSVEFFILNVFVMKIKILYYISFIHYNILLFLLLLSCCIYYVSYLKLMCLDIIYLFDLVIYYYIIYNVCIFFAFLNYTCINRLMLHIFVRRKRDLNPR